MNNSMHPEFYRFSVGFGPLFKVMSEFDLPDATIGNKYPPHNIVIIDDESFLIEIALAGFGRDEIEITHHNNDLLITGQKQKQGDDEKTRYIYHGIASRSFTKSFTTAEHVKITGAAFEDGILSIAVELQVPEDLKPKKIKIK